MDVVAHGLWGGALFGRTSKWQWRSAFLLGAAPDVLAFGPFLTLHWRDNRWTAFAPYVYASYNVTHSLIVWGIVFAAIWLLRRKPLWVLGAWGVHILCDIPTHSASFFPTPYLWPLATPLNDGIPWANLKFMAGNYLALLVTYACLVWRRRRYLTQ